MSEDKNGNKVIKLSTAVAFFAVFIALGCLVVAGSNQESFVEQFSFASTITSIVLSVIAIWMSISGERNTNEIKEKIGEAANRLEKTSSDFEKLGQKSEDSIKQQEDFYMNTAKNFNSILSELNALKNKVDISQEVIQKTNLLFQKDNTNGLEFISDSAVKEIYNNLLSTDVDNIFDKALNIVVEYFCDDEKLTYINNRETDDFYYYIKEKSKDKKESFDFIVGAAGTNFRLFYVLKLHERKNLRRELIIK